MGKPFMRQSPDQFGDSLMLLMEYLKEAGCPKLCNKKHRFKGV
jgi:hypothetical protein